MSTIIVITKEELSEIVQTSIRKVFAENNQPQSEQQDLVPIEEAMKITNLARQTLYGKVYDRKIPFIKREGSRKLFFSRKALLNWIQEGGNFDASI
ncbi:MAG: helix-turn-helix domain-containing protein [Bacteroidetes bacterium]|nr:helix-turn-helix domain-containing protein [Bacteroidota bacterium]